MTSAASWMRWLRASGRPGFAARRPLVAEVMEPRILYSADLGAALALGSGFAGIAEQRTLTEGGEYATPAHDVATSTSAASAHSSVGSFTELAFVDMSVASSEDLVLDLQAQGQRGRSIEIVRIAGDEDGVARITDTLAGRSDVAAVHVLSHGADGVIHLGSARIDAATLETRGQEIAAWGRALTDDADLLLYGCDVAAGPAGERFLGALGALTGADVAASADLTGAAALGGNWSMEERTGPIEAAIAIDLPTQSAWQGVLATAPTVTPIADQTTREDTATAAIAFTVGDADTPPASLVVTANTSDPAVLAAGGIVLGGAGANRTLTLTPVAGASGGPVTVTVDVSDGGLVTSTSFQLTVTPVNDAPAGADRTLTLIEDTPYTLTTADFGFSDVNDAPANAFQAVTFAAAPAAGSLANNGVAVGIGASVTAADIAAGRLVYTPALNGNGIAYAALSFQVQDDGGTANGGADLDPVANTLTFDVLPVNDAAPVNAVPAALTTNEDKALQFKPTPAPGTDITVSDVDGGNLTTTVSTTNGTLVVQPNPATAISGNRTSAVTITGLAADINAVLDGLKLDSVADYNGSATLTVTTSDDAGLSDTDALEITIVPVADIAADTATTPVDTPVTIKVLANDSFKNVGATITRVNGNPIADGAAAVTVPKGSVALAGGNLVFTPQASFVGVVPSFSYTVTSGGVDETASVDVTVNPTGTPVNSVPAAQATAEDTPKVFSTANGNAISVAVAGSVNLTTTVSASNGTLTAQAFVGATIANNGSARLTISGTAAAINGALDGLAYASAADYNGSAILTVSTSKGTLVDSDPIAVTISPVADAVPDSVGTSEGTAVSFNVLTGTNGASADSFEDPARSVTSVTQGAHGGVSFTAAGVLTYTPQAAYNGVDSFSYTVSSGAVTEVATVNVTIVAVNHAPVNTVPGAQTVDEDLVISITGISVNDPDGNLGTVRLTAANGILTVSLAGGAAVSAGANGSSTLTLSGGQAQIDAALATLAYQGRVDFFGADSLTVLASDTAGTPLTDSDTVAVAVRAVNDAPVAVGDSLRAVANTPVTYTAMQLLGNDSDVDNPRSDLRIAGVARGAGGTPVLNADGTVTFTPDAGFNGAANFTYTVTDGSLASARPATVSVAVGVVSHAPVAVDDSLAATEDTPITFAAANVLANDTDVDTPNAALTIASVTSGSGGTAVLNANGTVTFTPNPNFNGAANFSYTVSDGGLTSAATVMVNVVPVDDAPVAVGDGLAATENTPITFGATDLLGNDTDIDTPNAALRIASVSSGAGGTAVLNADGSVTFTPRTGFKGVADFAYTVTDGALTSTMAAPVTVAVTGVDNPVSAPKPAAPPEAAPAPPSVVVPPTQPVSGPPVEPVPVTPAPSKPAAPQTDASTATPVAASGGPSTTTPGPTPDATPAATAPTTPAAPPVSPATGPVQAPVTRSEMGTPAAGFGLVIDGLTPPVQVDRDLMAFARPAIDLGPSALVQRVSVESRAIHSEAAPESAMVFVKFDLTGRADGASGSDLQRTLRSSVFSDQLDHLRGNVQDELELDKTVTVSVAGVSLGLSLVYVLWLVRGGVLMGSYLSALPAWRVLDPLPVLSRVDEDAEEDDEALDAVTDPGSDPLRGFG